ncbi:MAG: hypothetical protein QOI13_3366, partial [Paraburkholderia sp.]|nr:hypothetical protein [Paraburkholderia sp.]
MQSRLPKSATKAANAVARLPECEIWAIIALFRWRTGVGEAAQVVKQVDAGDSKSPA